MKRLVQAVAFAATIMSAGAAQAFPDQPVTLVVPYPPGGASDLLGRVLAASLEDLGQPVVVQNMPGAGTVVGARAVAAAEPDGHTLLLATSTTLAINDALFPDLDYDSVADFTPIALVADVPFVLVVPEALGIETFEEFVELAQSRDLTFGTAGNGTPHHLFMELLLANSGLEATHIPYQGSANAIADLMGNQIDVIMADLAPVLPHIASGALKPLVVSTSERIEQLPDVPTADEAGVSGYEATAWQGIIGPAGLPDEVVATLNAALISALEDEDVQQRLTAGGLIARTSSPEEFAAYIETELPRWAEVVDIAGATVD